jgi:hypothetical protein
MQHGFIAHQGNINLEFLGGFYGPFYYLPRGVFSASGINGN